MSNRSIKFRGKRVDNGEWVYGYYGVVQINHGIWSRNGNEFPQWYQIEPETVGQFTGLTDKNGKEIYEGDILKTEFTICSWWFYSNPQPTGRDGYSSTEGICDVVYPFNVGNIYFPEKDFWFDQYPTLETEMKKRRKGEKINSGRNCEIIGNIHDNPELLT